MGAHGRAVVAKVTRTPGPADARLRVAIAGLQGLTGKVGWFKSAHYPDGTPVAYVAVIQEYGYPDGGIPPRLGMRETAQAKRKEWAALVASGARSVLAGKSTGPQVMEALGLKAAGDMRKHIAEVQSPPLKDDTIKARRAQRSDKVTMGNLSKPLVFTGHLLATLTNTVEKKG